MTVLAMMTMMMTMMTIAQNVSSLHTDRIDKGGGASDMIGVKHSCICWG